jgi:serine/threonine-protein kinase
LNSAASPTSQPGAVLLGKYRVDRVIGEGGMGFVVQATHTSLGHKVAIKVLREGKREGDHLARFRREAELTSGIRSDHIVQVFDAGVSQAGEPFIVMELLLGRTVGDEVHARGPLPVSEAVDLILQAARGLADAHAHGLVHRDVKPANLFIARRPNAAGVIDQSSPGVVKVLDFGLSKAPDAGGAAPLTSTFATFGTPQYMSPEQLRGARFADARSDQYALACVLYECLTARAPFDAESLGALALVIANDMPVPASRVRGGVPPGVDAAIARAMAKEPNARFSDVAAFAAALAPFGGASASAMSGAAQASLTNGARTSSGGDLAPTGAFAAFPPMDAAPKSASSDAFTRQLRAPSVSAAAAAPASAGVKGWSDVMPSAPGAQQRPNPTVVDAAGRASDAGTTRPSAAARRGGLLQSPLVIAGAVIISIAGMWLLYSIVRKVESGAAPQVSASTSASTVAAAASVEPDDEPAGSTDVVVAPAPSASASASASAAPSASASASSSAKPAPTQQSRRRRRHRH